MNNLDLMRKRLESQGGIDQESRMIQDKYKTFLKTLKYSYQGADVQLVQPYSECGVAGHEFDPSENPVYRALINPDKVKQDYDDKILSIEYREPKEEDTKRIGLLQPGDVFKWVGTDSRWIIYLEQLTEDAYFRGEIRRCNWYIRFRDEQGNEVFTWAAIRGPVETDIDSIQKNQIRVDRPNLSLNILLPQNEITRSIFKRYTRFLFDGLAWQVQTINRTSMTNIIEVVAQEYYINQVTDDVENEIANGLMILPQDPNITTYSDEPDALAIAGETFIKPMVTQKYKANQPGGSWSIKENVPATLKVVKDTVVHVTWNKTCSGQFTLCYKLGDITAQKIVVVETLF